MKKIFAFTMILLIFMVNQAISRTIQFRDYEWETPISEIEKTERRKKGR